MLTAGRMGMAGQLLEGIHVDQAEHWAVATTFGACASHSAAATQR